MLYENYLYGLPGFFTEEECDTIIRIADTVETKEGAVGEGTKENKDGHITDEIRSSLINWIGPQQLPIEIEQKIDDAMNMALKDTGWGYHIDYRQHYQFTTYNAPDINQKRVGDFYTWHTDAGHQLDERGQLRKLSFTLQLSSPEDYEGGYFQWLETVRCFDTMRDNATVDLTNGIKTLPYSVKDRGSIFFFPSFVHHQVTPVTRGTRKSFVGWCVGNQYV